MAADTGVIWPFFNTYDECIRGLPDTTRNRALLDPMLLLCICFFFLKLTRLVFSSFSLSLFLSEVSVLALSSFSLIPSAISKLALGSFYLGFSLKSANWHLVALAWASLKSEDCRLAAIA